MASHEIPSVFQERYQLMTKEEVIEQYKKDYEGFLAVLKQIPDHKIGEAFLNDWTIKEIVAHIASWSLETVEGIKTVLKGDIPWFFDEEKVNQFNEKEVNKRKNLSAEEVLEELKSNHNILINFLRKLPNTIFHQGFGQIWKEQKVTPALVCSYRHYLHHIKDIIQWLEKLKEIGY